MKTTELLFAKAVTASAGAAPVAMTQAMPNLLGMPWAVIGVAIIVAVAGGFVGTVYRSNKRPITLAVFAKDLVLAAGAGFIAFNTIADKGLSPADAAVILFVAGLAGQTVISGVIDMALQWLKSKGGK